MVLCMIPASFADTYSKTISDQSYQIDVFSWEGNDIVRAPILGNTAKGNSVTATYNYETEGEDVTGKFTEAKKMAIVKVTGFDSDFKTATNINVNIDGKKVESNELAPYASSYVGYNADRDCIYFPIELTKAGYTDTFLIEITGEKKDGDDTINLKETVKLSVRLENEAEYKNSKTATIAKVETNSNKLDAYTVADKFYLDFADDNAGGTSGEEIKITFKDNNGNLFTQTTWAYTNSVFAAVIDGVTQIGADGIHDGAQLDDSAASYKIRNIDAANNAKVTFKLENTSAIYETEEYTVVVRKGIKEADPKGIYFAEATKTIKIGEEYSPVVYGVATGKRVDATLIQGEDSEGRINNVIDIDDDVVLGTQEGVAYVTATYTTNDDKTYEASSMKIIVTKQGATDDDDDDKDGKTYIVTASSLRVRSGAGTNFSQIGSLKNGATVKVESIANGWAKLENGGYVSAQYLAEVVDNGEAQTMYVTARTLNVRKGPGTSYAKAGTLSRGTAVQVVGFSGNWAKLSNGYYVSTSYLAK